MNEVDVLILGAGLAGLSSSYHIGHDRCVLLEANSHPFGHISTRQFDGFTWDEGPHVSFTEHQYVRELFAKSVKGEFFEFPVKTTNFYKGRKIDHPAQSNLYQVDEPLRSRCIEDFLNSRHTQDVTDKPKNYEEWLYRAFGKTFADTFPRAYTRKYWTTNPENMTVDWVGDRVFFPKVDDVLSGAKEALPEQTHYIKSVRYPKNGGYQSYGELLARDANIRCSERVSTINLNNKTVSTASGEIYSYKKLINTIPLPLFIGLCVQTSKSAKVAAKKLCCTELLLVNVMAEHPTKHPEHWFYVYDEDYLSTRIYCTEQLSKNNAPLRNSGIQVEVYASKYRPFNAGHNEIGERVIEELKKLNFISEAESTKPINFHTQHVTHANIVFDHQREKSLEVIFSELEKHGLFREKEDLKSNTDWSLLVEGIQANNAADLFLAGRFGQWKYFWTDDCVLQGKRIANYIK